MATPYNFSNINGSGLLKLTTTVNTELFAGMYGNLFLITVFVIAISAFYANTSSVKRSFGAASLIVFMLSSFFRIINLIPDITFYVCLVLLAVSTILLFILKE